MIRRELSRVACATQFLTRIPTPPFAAWSDDLLARSARYFPLVGLIVGGLSAGAFRIGRWIWPSGPLPAVLAVALAVVLTGGFHEDGLADTADGLGGGCTPEQRLVIMKDSRLGSYGALALILTLGLRIAALSETSKPLLGCAALLAAHALGRAAAVLVMAALPYAANPERSKLKPSARGVRHAEVLVALVLGLAPLGLLPPTAMAAGLVVGAAAGAWPALAAKRLIGGCTGDVLGAVEQACETGVLIGVSAALGLGLA